MALNTPPAIVADLLTEKPHYDQHDHSGLNGTRKMIEMLTDTSKKRGISAVEATLQSIKETDPKVYAHHFGKADAGANPLDKRREALLAGVFTEEERQHGNILTIYEALKNANKIVICQLATSLCQLDNLHLQRIQIYLHEVFGKDFPKREFQELIREERLKQQRIARRKPVTTLREIRNTTFEKRQWLIDGLIPEVGLIALAGKGKIGKSWMGLDFCIGLATGGITLQSIQVPKRKVLYMALEDDQQRLQERANILLQHQDYVEGLDNLLILNDCERLDQEGITYLEGIIQEHPDLKAIIIDPWIKVKPRTRGHVNGYDADYDSLDAIYRLAYKYHICVIIYFHLRKLDAEDPLDALNATSGVGACVDGALILKRQRQEASATLSRIGRIFDDDHDMDLEFAGGRWKMLSEEERTKKLSEQRQEILAVLAQNKEDGLTLQEVAVILEKPEKQNNIRQLLWKMSQGNLIAQRGKKYFPLDADKKEKQDNDDNKNTDNSDNSDNRPPFMPPVALPEALLSPETPTDNRVDNIDNRSAKQLVKPIEMVSYPEKTLPVITVIDVIPDLQKMSECSDPGLTSQRECA